MQWIIRFGLFAVMAVFSISLWVNSQPHGTNDISQLTRKLYQFGAISFVHEGYDGSAYKLFECVKNGHELTQEQSTIYRVEYQRYLQSQARLFTRLDENIEFATDVGMETTNNVGSKGIAGLHDMHDMSAGSNLVDLDRQVKALSGSGFFKRISLANDAYKDLTDLMVHLAPAVHSVGLLELEPVDANIEPQIAAHYLDFYSAMKNAQAEAVNSSTYFEEVERALAAYDLLVAQVQNAIWAENSAVIHALSGRWLSLQTIAPRLKNEEQFKAIKTGHCPVD